MNKGEKISEFWRNEYSRKIESYKAFHVSDHFRKVAALFSPGLTYFYVLNVHNLELDFVSPEIEDFIGVSPKDTTIEKLLGTALPQELEWVEKKEKVVKDFYQNFLKSSDRTKYKLVYTYKMRDSKGKKRVILHQATPLTTTEDGAIQHVLSIHTDISHITSRTTRKISFIDLLDSCSYYNLDPSEEIFDPELANSEPEYLFENLSIREKEILSFLARGLAAKEIAEVLHVSIHTIQTHRKNILKKTRCRNTAEVVAEGMVSGFIDPVKIWNSKK